MTLAEIPEGVAATPGLRAVLRNATHEAHVRLDAFVGEHLLRGGIHLLAYAKLLVKLHAFLTRWEAQIAVALADTLPGFCAPRSKLAMLLADIAAVGSAPGDIAGAPDVLPTPSAAAALGSMYVIEGSTLGGRFIAKQLKQIMPAMADHPATRYFDSYGADVPARWREFVAVLEEHVRPADYAEATAAAIDTFSAMERLYQQALTCPGRHRGASENA